MMPVPRPRRWAAVVLLAGLAACRAAPAERTWNVLVAGPVGGGKSRLVNAALGRTGALEGYGDGAVTQASRRYCRALHAGERNGTERVCFYDTPGVDGVCVAAGAGNATAEGARRVPPATPLDVWVANGLRGPPPLPHAFDVVLYVFRAHREREGKAPASKRPRAPALPVSKLLACLGRVQTRLAAPPSSSLSGELLELLTDPLAHAVDNGDAPRSLPIVVGVAPTAGAAGAEDGDAGDPLAQRADACPAVGEAPMEADVVYLPQLLSTAPAALPEVPALWTRLRDALRVRERCAAPDTSGELSRTPGTLDGTLWEAVLELDATAYRAQVATDAVDLDGSAFVPAWVLTLLSLAFWAAVVCVAAAYAARAVSEMDKDSVRRIHDVREKALWALRHARDRSLAVAEAVRARFAAAPPAAPSGAASKKDVVPDENEKDAAASSAPQGDDALAAPPGQRQDTELTGEGDAAVPPHARQKSAAWLPTIASVRQFIKRTLSIDAKPAAEARSPRRQAWDDLVEATDARTGLMYMARVWFGWEQGDLVEDAGEAETAPIPAMTQAGSGSAGGEDAPPPPSPRRQIWNGMIDTTGGGVLGGMRMRVDVAADESEDAATAAEAPSLDVPRRSPPSSPLGSARYPTHSPPRAYPSTAQIPEHMQASLSEPSGTSHATRPAAGIRPRRVDTAPWDVPHGNVLSERELRRATSVSASSYRTMSPPAPLPSPTRDPSPALVVPLPVRESSGECVHQVGFDEIVGFASTLQAALQRRLDATADACDEELTALHAPRNAAATPPLRSHTPRGELLSPCPQADVAPPRRYASSSGAGGRELLSPPLDGQDDEGIPGQKSWATRLFGWADGVGDAGARRPLRRTASFSADPPPYMPPAPAAARSRSAEATSALARLMGFGPAPEAAAERRPAAAPVLRPTLYPSDAGRSVSAAGFDDRLPPPAPPRHTAPSHRPASASRRRPLSESPGGRGTPPPPPVHAYLESPTALPQEFPSAGDKARAIVRSVYADPSPPPPPPVRHPSLHEELYRTFRDRPRLANLCDRLSLVD